MGLTVHYPTDGENVLKTFIAFGSATADVYAVNGKAVNKANPKDIICGLVVRGPNCPSWLIIFEGLCANQYYTLTITDHTGKNSIVIDDLHVEDDPQQIYIHYPPSTGTPTNPYVLPGKSFSAYGYTSNSNSPITGNMKKQGGGDNIGSTTTGPPGAFYWVVSFTNLDSSPPLYDLIVSNVAGDSTPAPNLKVP